MKMFPNPKQQRKSSRQPQWQPSHDNTYQYENPNKKNTNNINNQLASNCTILINTVYYLKQSIKQRVTMIANKYNTLVTKNKQQIAGITQSRDEDLKLMSKSLNDPIINTIFDNRESFNKYNKFLSKLSSNTDDINTYIKSEQLTGKKFWDKHQQLEKQRKKKAQIYYNYIRQLQQLTKKQRQIFTQINTYENQISNELLKNYNQPDNIKKAQRYNDQVDKYKNTLKNLQQQKNQIKDCLLQIIQQIIIINTNDQKNIINRERELNQLFIGNQNAKQLENLIEHLQKILISYTQPSNKNPNPLTLRLKKIQQLSQNYNIVINQLDRLQQLEQQQFLLMQKQLKQTLKNAIFQKLFLVLGNTKQDQLQLIKKYKIYKKFITQMSGQKNQLKVQINIIKQSNQIVTPHKQRLQNQDSRKQQLKTKVAKLCQIQQQLQLKQKQFRSYQSDLSQLLTKQKTLQTQILISAKKANLRQYKLYTQDLKKLSRLIQKKNDSVLNDQITDLRAKIQHKNQQIYNQYQDIIQEIQLDSEQNVLGSSFLSKLEKRLSFI